MDADNMSCYGRNENTKIVRVPVELKKIFSKSYKESILRNILIFIHAFLNANDGGTVEFVFNEHESQAEVPQFLRMIEQQLKDTITTQRVTSHITFERLQDGVIHCKVKNCDALITTRYNLYIRSETQANLIPSFEQIKDTILTRRHIPQPVEILSHHKEFTINKSCGGTENKNTEFKNLEAGASKRTTLADRMTGKGNKFRCYVSAFANHNGGHIYYGITDDGVVEGEFISNEKAKNEIRKKVEKAINKMIWPEQIGEPKRGEHWEIFFEPVVDENSKPVPSTFVIVIYIAACLGGVFTEVPECYEMVDGIAQMLFVTWKRRILAPPVSLEYRDRFQPVFPRVTWSSYAAQSAFTITSEKLEQFINNGDWNACSKACRRLQEQSELAEVRLAILSRMIIVCSAKRNFNKAEYLLELYEDDLHLVRDWLIFELIYLNLIAALKRARGDFEGLAELLTEVLSKAELIEPGLVTATVYIFAASITDLIRFEEPQNEFSPEVLSTRALEHLQYVRDFPSVVADKQQRAHIILATFHLGCNLSGQPTKDSIDTSDISKAKASIMAVHQSTYEKPMSRYREVQLKLVQSIYHYRHSQVSPDKRVYFLRNAFNYANEAERLARQYQFTEMVEWSKRNKALCTEELVKEKLLELNSRFTIGQ